MQNHYTMMNEQKRTLIETTAFRRMPESCKPLNSLDPGIRRDDGHRKGNNAQPHPPAPLLKKGGAPNLPPLEKGGWGGFTYRQNVAS